MKHVPATLPMPGERIYTAIRFAACQPDDPGALDEIWRELHDSILATFPTQRRSPIGMATYAARDAGDVLDSLSDPAVAGVDRREYARLREEVAKLGLLAVVFVDVAMDVH